MQKQDCEIRPGLILFRLIILVITIHKNLLKLFISTGIIKAEIKLWNSWFSGLLHRVKAEATVL
jgi:hypothetical protein